MYEWIIKILVWLIFGLLLSVVPAFISESRQRPKVTPVIVYSILCTNGLIYLIMILVTILRDPSFYSYVINSWGFKPHEFLNPLSNPDGILGNIKTYITLITSQFLHVGFFHLIGNMLCLHVFAPDIESGQNVKYRGMSKRSYNSFFPFAFFYLFCGIGAAIAHALIFGFTGPDRSVLVGASGAISGVLAAFLCKCWKDSRKMKILVFYFFPLQISVNIYLIYWIILQFALAWFYGGEANVGYVAHLGGALTGFLLATFVFPWTGIIVKSQPRTWFGKRVKTFSR